MAKLNQRIRNAWGNKEDKLVFATTISCIVLLARHGNSPGDVGQYWKTLLK